MAVDAEDGAGVRGRSRPGRSGRSSAATEVDDSLNTSEIRDRENDLADEQKVKRSVKQSEGGALSGARERGTLSKAASPLDIGR
jgi:hypothetical protein